MLRGSARRKIEKAPSYRHRIHRAAAMNFDNIVPPKEANERREDAVELYFGDLDPDPHNPNPPSNNQQENPAATEAAVVVVAAAVEREETDVWSCSLCSFKNESLKLICAACNKGQQPLKHENWSCEACSFRNPLIADICQCCESPKKNNKKKEQKPKQKRNMNRSFSSPGVPFSPGEYSSFLGASLSSLGGSSSGGSPSGGSSAPSPSGGGSALSPELMFERRGIRKRMRFAKPYSKGLNFGRSTRKFGHFKGREEGETAEEREKMAENRLNKIWLSDSEGDDNDDDDDFLQGNKKETIWCCGQSACGWSVNSKELGISSMATPSCLKCGAFMNVEKEKKSFKKPMKKFKDDWECSNCTTVNLKEAVRCVVCFTPQKSTGFRERGRRHFFSRSDRFSSPSSSKGSNAKDINNKEFVKTLKTGDLVDCYCSISDSWKSATILSVVSRPVRIRVQFDESEPPVYIFYADYIYPRDTPFKGTPLSVVRTKLRRTKRQRRLIDIRPESPSSLDQTTSGADSDGESVNNNSSSSRREVSGGSGGGMGGRGESVGFSPIKIHPKIINIKKQQEKEIEILSDSAMKLMFPESSSSSLSSSLRQKYGKNWALRGSSSPPPPPPTSPSPSPLLSVAFRTTSLPRFKRKAKVLRPFRRSARIAKKQRYQLQGENVEVDEIAMGLPFEKEESQQNLKTISSNSSSSSSTSQSASEKSKDATETATATATAGDDCGAHDIRLCVICEERDKMIRFGPCGHFACCKECADKVTACTMCRKTITRRDVTYLV